MAFFEKVKQIATGKSEAERRQESAANIQIRQKVLAAELRERQKANVMLAEERIRHKAQEQLKKIRRPTGMFGSVPGGAYGSPFERSRQPIKTQIPIGMGKRRKKKKSKRRKQYQNNSPGIVQQAQKRWDPIFGGYR